MPVIIWANLSALHRCRQNNMLVRNLFSLLPHHFLLNSTTYYFLIPSSLHCTTALEIVITYQLSFQPVCIAPLSVSNAQFHQFLLGLFPIALIHLEIPNTTNLFPILFVMPILNQSWAPQIVASLFEGFLMN